MRDELNADEFERRFRSLLARGVPRENAGSLECVRCTSVTNSTFCRDSERLIRCHYCVRCTLCSDCLHCKNSRNLIHCSHCVESETSINCSYLVRSVAMTDSSYCFGCVGLTAADFCILNQPYDRATYFALTRELSRQLKLGP